MTSSGGTSDEDPSIEHPIDGNALMLAAAKASVTPEQLPNLLGVAADYLGERRADYCKRYEAVHEDEDTVVLLVPEGHWADVGEDLDVGEREADALRRAHLEHLRRLGSEQDRREEFDHALDLREAVVIATGDGD